MPHLYCGVLQSKLLHSVSTGCTQLLLLWLLSEIHKSQHTHVFFLSSNVIFCRHKNSILFWLTQVSFLITTFKYIAAMILAASKYTGDDEEEARVKNRALVGSLLIVMDVTVSFHFFFFRLSY